MKRLTDWLPRRYVFTVTVKGTYTKKAAELALLCAFAKRDPDGCEFHLSKKAKVKK